MNHYWYYDKLKRFHDDLNQKKINIFGECIKCLKKKSLCKCESQPELIASNRERANKVTKKRDRITYQEIGDLKVNVHLGRKKIGEIRPTLHGTFRYYTANIPQLAGLTYSTVQEVKNSLDSDICDGSFWEEEVNAKR